MIVSEPQAARAEHWNRLAYDRTGELGARMTRLRAATRLGRLSRAGGDPDAAARTLGPMYATFTEGFATADLLEAHELLTPVAPIRTSWLSSGPLSGPAPYAATNR